MKITLETKLSNNSHKVYIVAIAHFRYKKKNLCFGEDALELFDLEAPEDDLLPDRILAEKLLVYEE